MRASGTLGSIFLPAVALIGASTFLLLLRGARLRAEAQLALAGWQAGRLAGWQADRLTGRLAATSTVPALSSAAGVGGSGAETSTSVEASPAAHGPASSRACIVHLVSHRGCARCNPKKFDQQIAKLRNETARTPVIGQAHLYTQLPGELLGSPRWAEHLQHSRGRGYWFWKAALINMHIGRGEILDGDIVIWLDADKPEKLRGQLAPFAKRMMVNAGGPDLWVRDGGLPEHIWTKGDIFERFGASWNDTRYGLTRQTTAQSFVARLNARTREFFHEWEDLVADFHLVSDERSRTGANSPQFKENRHDQSLFSMLLKASLNGHPDLGVRALQVEFR